MDESIINELKMVQNIIEITRCRARALKDDVDYVVSNSNIFSQLAGGLGAYKRLEHEVMFLCVDTYSLHEGLSKRKSFYSKIIKHHGRQFTKIDKSQTVMRGTFIGIGVIGDEAIEEFNDEETDFLLDSLNKRALASRREAQRRVGISSHRHPELDQWIDSLIDKSLIEKLASYRKEFAHRFDSLDNLKRELQNVSTVKRLNAMIDVVTEILESYSSCINNIFAYAASTQYEVSGFRYSSISAIRQFDENKGRKHL